MKGREGLRFLITLLAALTVLAAGLAPAATAQSPWPIPSNLPAEPATTIGALPNGLRYVIRANPTPRGAVSIRMRVDVGAFHETESQKGIAHFLEHMAFRGTTGVPDGQFEPAIGRLGMRRGQDSNAFTSGTQTFYKFDLPKNDEATLTEAFRLLREVASEQTFAEPALTDEKRVVESELRFRDTPPERMRQAALAFHLKGQLAGERHPGGDLATVMAATPEQLRAFYRAWYRPERTTLIVVGDAEPAAILRHLQTRFGDWRSEGPAGPEPDLGRPSPAGGASYVAGTGFPPQLTVSWLSPPSPDRTLAEVRRRHLESLAFWVVNQRFEQAALAGNGRPFASASLIRRFTGRSADEVTLTFSGEPRFWPQALQSLEILRRQAVEQGLTQAEVDRGVAALSASFRNQASLAPVQSSPFLADFLLAAIDRGGALTGPETMARLGLANIEGARAEEVTAVLREVFTGRPYIFMAGPTRPPNGDQLLAVTYAAAAQAPLAPYQPPPPPKAWPFADFGPSGQVAERSRIEPLDVTLVRFANGVRLTVKPTEFVRDQISVNVKFGAGRLALPRDRISPLWAFTPMLVEGGLRDFTPVDIRAALSGSSVTLNASLADDGVILTGGTREAELDRQLQLMAAQATAPGWRSETFENIRQSALQQWRNSRGNPYGVLGREMPALLRSGDARWRAADMGEIVGASQRATRALFEPDFGATPLQVVIVGDVTVDRAIAAVAATFGALPVRPAPTRDDPATMAVRFPQGGGPPVVLEHAGRADQGVAVIAWPGVDFTDLQAPRDLRFVEALMVEKVTDAVRRAAGAAYTVQSELHNSTLLPGFGYLRLSADVPPDKADLFFEAASKAAAELRAAEVPQADLERLRGPVIQGIVRDRQTNTYWAGQLLDIDNPQRPMRQAAVLTVLDRMEAVTPAGIRAAAGRLTDDNAFRILVRPAAVAR